MGRLIVSVLAGFLFGVGLAVSGMTHPEKVLNFLDVTGAWDPSLLFVMGGAVAVTSLAFGLILGRPAPLLGDGFRITRGAAVDGSLVAGAALFGVGWGIGGYCPGPAVALFGAPNRELWLFFPALLAGSLLHGLFRSWQAARSTPASASPPDTCA